MQTAPALLPFLMQFLETARTLTDEDREALEDAIEQNKPLSEWKDLLDRCIRREMREWNEQSTTMTAEITDIKEKRDAEAARIAPRADVILEAHAKAADDAEQTFKTNCSRIERSAEGQAETRKRSGEANEMEEIRKKLQGK